VIKEHTAYATKRDDEMDEKAKLLVRQETYLEAGIHIGTKIRTHDMKRFIFKRRDDDLFVLDLRKIDERLLYAAKMLSKYNPEEILVVASRMYSSNAAAKFSQLTGIPLIKGRFVPGTMTNLSSSGFREPKIVFVCDPKGEREAIVESAKNGVPLISLCDTDNETRFIDLVVPANNKGKKSLALVFYILAREYLVSKGVIQGYSDFKYDVNYFEQMDFAEEKKSEPKQEEAVAQENPAAPPAETKEEPKKE
jgi:small subunit ribosomal protein S2